MTCTCECASVSLSLRPILPSLPSSPLLSPSLLNAHSQQLIMMMKNLSMVEERTVGVGVGVGEGFSRLANHSRFGV